MWDFGLYILVGLFLLVIGIQVHRDDPKALANKTFLGLTIAMTLWLLTNYWSLTVSDPALFLLLVRLVMVWSDWTPPLVYVFSLTFPTPGPQLTGWRLRLLIGWSIFISLLNLTPFVFASVKIENGSLTPVPSWGMIFDIINIVGLFGLAAWEFYRQSRRVKGLERVRIRYLSLGVGVAVFFALLFNMILPVFWKNQSLMNLGIALMSFALVGIIGYAMVRTTFAGIDFVLAKIAYYSILAIWISLPPLFVYYLPPGTKTITAIDISFFIVWSFILVWLYNHVGIFLDRKIVNHGADLQTEHDKLFAQIGHELDTSQILDGTLGFLSEIIKNKGSIFIGDFADNGIVETVGDWDGEVPARKIRDLVARKWREKAVSEIMLDDVSRNHLGIYRTLVPLLRRHEVAGVFPVTVYNEFWGVLLVSNKENGNPYFTQDVELIRSTLDEIGPLLAQASIHQSAKDYNLKLQLKIDRATRRLQKMNEELIVADKLKDEFVSVASHELRTPMTAIKGYLWLVYKNNTPDKIAINQKYIEIALKSTERLIALVNDMLTISRIEGGRFELNPQMIDAKTLATQTREDLLPIARDKKLKFKVEAPLYPLYVRVDEKRVSEVIHNLVGNALKFTTKGSVTIKLRHDKKHVFIDVIDTGCGIDAADFDKLFSKFSRMEKSYVKIKETGTGLGLYISRQIMLLHHGDIAFTSTLGKGSTFTMTFPRVLAK